MDNKTTGIVATVVTALLCGCPGLGVLCFGAFMAFLGASPDTFPNTNVDNPDVMMAMGAAILCLGIFFVAIPFIVGFFTLRNRSLNPSEEVIELDLDEPLPPAI